MKTDGERVSVTFNGLTLGIFSGDLQFTVYKGSNLLRQEALASTQAKDVAFIYKAGLKGFAIAKDSKVVWRDTSQMWQEQDFGGAVNQQPVNIRARNRLEIMQAGAGSLAVFPPPHKFFFARENEVNGGYVYTRKDSDSSFSLGVMQPERCEGYDPWGVAPEVWTRRASTAQSAGGELCAVQRAAGNRAADGGLLLPERDGKPRHAAGRDGVYARRCVQAGGGIQDGDRALPPGAERDGARPGNHRT